MVTWVECFEKIVFSIDLCYPKWQTLIMIKHHSDIGSEQRAYEAILGLESNLNIVESP